jgi:PKHD-type hydroxylase
MDTVLGNINDKKNNDDLRPTRKLTAVMLLNQPGKDFTGGDLQLFEGTNNEYSVDQEKGKIILFPSFMIHRVTPILSGIRKSIVIWITGPKFR